MIRPWIPFAQIGAIIAVVSWIYWPAIHGGWLWDDHVYITENRALTEWSGLWKIWLVPGTYFEYYPGTETLQWLQAHLCGDDTFGYHLTNVVLHILNACLFWRLLGKLGLRFGWLGAVIFAIHPMNVESVAWISELKNTLSLAPTLLCLIAFIDYETGGDQRRYGMALVLFGIAMLCKDSMSCLPFCLLLYLGWKRGRIGLTALKTTAPFFMVSILCTAMTLWAAARYAQNLGVPVSAAVAANLDPRAFFVLTVCATFSFLFKYVYPFALVAFYPPWSEGPDSLLVVLQLVVFGVAAGVLFGYRWKWRREFILGFGFFFLNLLPLTVLIFARYPYFVWSIDHSAYLPYLGLIGLTVAGFERFYDGRSDRVRPLLIALMIMALLPVAFFSRSYASNFVDAKGLWIYTLQHGSGDLRKPPAGPGISDEPVR